LQLQLLLHPTQGEKAMELKDIYQRITDQVVSELENGVCPWIKPWNAAHLDGRVVLPLRHCVWSA
jgi:antirestriction protein ArdC